MTTPQIPSVEEAKVALLAIVLRKVTHPSLRLGDRYDEAVTTLISAVQQADRQEIEKLRDQVTALELRPLMAERVIDMKNEEIERLTGCLTRANANHEDYERRYYLAIERAEQAEQANEQLRTDNAALCDGWQKGYSLGRSSADAELRERAEQAERERDALQQQVEKAGLK